MAISGSIPNPITNPNRLGTFVILMRLKSVFLLFQELIVQIEIYGVQYAYLNSTPLLE